jgi:hypothetical protein
LAKDIQRKWEIKIFIEKKYSRMIKTVGEIIRKFRTEGACIKFSPKTISYMAGKLGYHIRRGGGKVGYDQSLITAISRHIMDAVEYERGIGTPGRKKVGRAQAPTDYYSFNGERENVDYEWEKNEGIIRNAIIEAINGLDMEKLN